MYTIKEICSGASIMMRSVLGRKREYRIQFNKEKNGCWYVDFPHWPFSHDNLAMVSGADKMLELLSNGNLFVKVSVIPATKHEKLFTHGGMLMDLQELLNRKVDLVVEGTLRPYAAGDKLLIYERKSEG